MINGDEKYRYKYLLEYYLVSFFFLEGWLKVNRTIEIFFLSFIVFQDIETRTTNELVEL